MNATDAQKTLNDMNSGKITWDDNLRAQANNALSGVGGGGGGSFQMPDMAAFAREQAAAQKQLMAEQAAKENDFLSRYRSAVAGQEGLGALAGRIGNELGLPQLRQNAFALQSSLGKIPAVQKQATQGFDVNQNQMDRLIAHKQAELAPSAAAASSQEQQAEQQLGQQMGYAVADQAKQLQPFQTEASMLSDRLAREVTGFTQEQTNQLNGLLAQISAGVQLSAQQMQAANALADRENQYKIAQANIDAQNKNTSVTEKNGRKVLMDMNTGAIVSDLGPVSTGTTTPISFGSSVSPWTITQDQVNSAIKSQGTTPTASTGFQAIPFLNQPGLTSYSSSGLTGADLSKYTFGYK